MREQIIAILSDLRPEFDFTENVNFIEEGMLDSFDIVTLVTELEGKFDVTIDGEQVLPENFSSIESIETLVNNSEKNA
jgi:acyl carrier protein